MIEFIIASHNNEVLQKNIFSSCGIGNYPVHIQRGFTNVSKAYNSVKTNAQVIIYVHEDVFLPKTFEKDLYKALYLVPDDWAVLGVAGVKLINGKKQNIGYINDRGRLWGKPLDNPVEVDTLDELLLITRGDFVFDEQFPLDFYGADICLQAKAQGRKCYAINAFCEHNSSRVIGGRTPAFYEAEKRFRNKWIDYLPIGTTCSTLT